MLMGKLGN